MPPKNSNRPPAVATAGQALSHTDTPTIDPLSAAVQSAVERALDARWDELLEAVGTRPLPRYIDRSELGQMLQVSPPVIRKMELEGMPTVRLGECIRYPLDAVTAWLASRGGAQ